MPKPIKYKLVYENKPFRIEEFMTPHGSKFSRVTGFDSVGMLPILDNGKILLERQYRYVLNRFLYEIPAGRIEKGEKPVASAKRELMEETGYAPGKLTLMFKGYTGPGHTTEFMHVYLAEKLRKAKLSMDIDEIIETEEVSLGKALEMIRKNAIRDHKTIASILFYNEFFK